MGTKRESAFWLAAYFFEFFKVLAQKGDRLLGLAQAQLHDAVLEQVFDIVLADVGLAFSHSVVIVACCSGVGGAIHMLAVHRTECVEYRRSVDRVVSGRC